MLEKYPVRIVNGLIDEWKPHTSNPPY